MPDVKLDAADAAELAGMLQFHSEWLASDPGRLSASLARSVGYLAHGLRELRADLERFVFLLGGSDGEQLFGPYRGGPPGQPSLRGSWPASTSFVLALGATCAAR